MWFYLGLSIVGSILAAWNYKKLPTVVLSVRHAAMLLTEFYKIVRKNGIGVCLVWTRQVIANQIGNRLVEMHHRHYVIHYPYGVTWYKIVVPRKRGPCLIDTVVDHEGNDVKTDVFGYMGPSHNFHGQQITPKMLGYRELTFTTLTGDTVTFGETEIIKV